MFQCWVFCHNCARLKFWIAHHCRSLCLSFSINSNSLLLSKMCDTSKMIIGLLIWEGNVYLHSFMFWLSLSSEVINEGSSCFQPANTRVMLMVRYFWGVTLDTWILTTEVNIFTLKLYKSCLQVTGHQKYK